MQTIKQEALNAILRLPDSVNFDDIMYRLFVPHCVGVRPRGSEAPSV